METFVPLKKYEAVPSTVKVIVLFQVTHIYEKTTVILMTQMLRCNIKSNGKKHAINLSQDGTSDAGHRVPTLKLRRRTLNTITFLAYRGFLSLVIL